MHSLHAREAGSDLRWERRGLLRLHVDMKRHVLGGSRHPAFGRMKQLLEIVHSLGVKLEQLEGNAHPVAGVELAQIADMHLGSKAGMTAVFHVVGTAADQLEGLV